MRIGLNLLHALPEIGGGWNYIRNLIKALAEVDQVDSFIVFANRESERLVPEQPNFDLVPISLESADRPRRVIYEHTTLLRLARRHRLGAADRGRGDGRRVAGILERKAEG